jgi:acetylornithine deacetylase/succinyl-diaminopimelate desuccinylase-like protein
MAVAQEAQEVVALLQGLLRINTVNPPGNERPAQELIEAPLRAAGFEVELTGPDPERPNLVARLRGQAPGPVLGLLSHVDTVIAEPAGWRHDPWSGALDEGCVWGRGALDMKSHTAAEVVAACSLARAGWRPARGDLVVISVIDEEVGGAGAAWVTEERPDLVRCDYLLNEGGGASFSLGGERVYDVCVGEKGVFRFTLTVDGVAGHASIPGAGDNALFKLPPLLETLRTRRPDWDVTPGARAFLEGLGLWDGDDPGRAVERLRAIDEALAATADATLRVTLAPTMVDASDAMNVIPGRARLHVDCRTPPGMDEAGALRRIREVLGDDGYRLEFGEKVIGNSSPPESPLMDALRDWVGEIEPGARCVPAVTTGYTDSVAFRSAFPDCVAYGFFPHRHMSAELTSQLVHSHDERIDVRDLALAVECYRSVALRLLG